MQTDNTKAWNGAETAQKSHTNTSESILDHCIHDKKNLITLKWENDSRTTQFQFIQKCPWKQIDFIREKCAAGIIETVSTVFIKLDKRTF